MGKCDGQLPSCPLCLTSLHLFNTYIRLTYHTLYNNIVRDCKRFYFMVQVQVRMGSSECQGDEISLPYKADRDGGAITSCTEPEVCGCPARQCLALVPDGMVCGFIVIHSASLFYHHHHLNGFSSNILKFLGGPYFMQCLNFIRLFENNLYKI